jgi:hypothetical protein
VMANVLVFGAEVNCHLSRVEPSESEVAGRA